MDILRQWEMNQARRVLWSSLDTRYEGELILQDAALSNPRVVKALVKKAIAGEPQLAATFREATHTRVRGKRKERGHMRTTMSQPQALEGLNRLISAGFKSARLRPRSWNPNFYAIEIDTTVHTNPSALERTIGRWNPNTYAYEVVSGDVTETTNLYSLDHVDAFILNHRPKPLPVIGEFVGNNCFRFRLPNAGKVIPGPKHPDRWTLAEVRNAGGEVVLDNQTYILTPPANLFNQGSKR